jgi:transposase InsO family protein
MKDLHRYTVVQDVVAKRITGLQAAAILGLTPVHISRLKQRFLAEGFEGLVRKSLPVSPNQQVTDAERATIIQLRHERYFDFNLNHFKEKLNELHQIPYRYTTIRRILLEAGLHVSKKKKVVHRMRRRMPKAGMLVQMDSSQHHWLPEVQEKWWLIAMIDDANNEVPYAAFSPHDTFFANLAVLRHFIERKGLFISLYVDRASHFTTTRYAGIHVVVNPEPEETQIERALTELEITLIPAHSPQAKGRIERLFGTFQDRLIKEMRVANIKTYTQANQFLVTTFLPDYNSRFALPGIESVYRPLSQELNLDTIFCRKFERTVNQDNTIQVQGQPIQIPPSPSYRSLAHRKVEVCILEDNRVLLLFNHKLIGESTLATDGKRYKKEQTKDKITCLRTYFTTPKKTYIPPPNHPWRKFKLGKSLTFQKVKCLTY